MPKKNSTPLVTPPPQSALSRRKNFERTFARRARVGVISIFLLLASVAIGLWYYFDYYSLRFVQGVHIGVVDVSGNTISEARAGIDAYRAALESDGIAVRYQDTSLALRPTVSAPNGVTLTNLYSIDEDMAIADAFRIGHEDALLTQIQSTAKGLISGVRVPFQVTVDRDALFSLLDDTFAPFEQPARDAAPHLEEGVKTLTVLPEQSGTVFRWPEVYAEVLSRLTSGSQDPIALSLVTDMPAVTAQDSTNALNEAQKMLAQAPLKLVGRGKSWNIDASTLAAWLQFVKKNGVVSADLSQDAVRRYLATIAPEVEQRSKNAKFAVANGRVTEFQAGVKGIAIDYEGSRDAIFAALKSEVSQDIALAFLETDPEIATSSVNSLGITELVAEGRTNFAGSPKNRRHNIGVAANDLNGILIAPGEIFSLIKALGSIDTAHGYLPELVIKGDRTIPEVGGGLCQIGTTFFRVVLNTGLPVVERRNHSYRVSYYEPPVGMDATIYDPAPDFKFTNDYPHHLLLQTRIENNDLIFEFWGTKDGRVAESSTPRVYNVVKPGPTKLIETEELAPGVKKCIEHAHSGSDAEFTYTVKYQDGSVQKKVFTSHYRPWQEVCLVGKAPTPPAPSPALENSNTNSSE